MKHTLSLPLALLVVAGTAATAQPTGTINAGDVAYSYLDTNATSGALADLEVDTGTDHLFAQWWWYRLASDTAETPLPQPIAESYVDNVATLDFDLGGGLTAREEVTLADGGETSGIARHDLTVFNSSGASVSITVFHYNDYDLDGSLLGDAAVLLGRTHIGVRDTSAASYRGLGADAYQVTAFAEIANSLGDDAETELNNSGLPFGPGDFTGAWQWNAIEIPAGASITYTAVKAINSGAVPFQVAFFGDCPGIVEVEMAGATPNGDVAVLASDALGSSPAGGPCADATLGLDNPSLLATPSANDSGEFNADLNLPAGACDRVIQLVDLASCNVSNVDTTPAQTP